MPDSVWLALIVGVVLAGAWRAEETERRERTMPEQVQRYEVQTAHGVVVAREEEPQGRPVGWAPRPARA